MTPTEEAYSELQQAFDHFNDRLFGGEIPPVLLTLQRQANTCGYFSPERFVHRSGERRTAEIAINPEYFGLKDLLDLCQTCAHELVHAWQEVFGTPGRRRYHNREWADKMISIGLMPSDTGRPGGRQTGEKISDYPIPGGLFLAAAEELMATGWGLSWIDRYPARGTVTTALAGGGTLALAIETGHPLTVSPAALVKPVGRVTFRCPGCGARAWGKPALQIICAPCAIPFATAGKPALSASAP